jgi:probable rRNA maturation factor
MISSDMTGTIDSPAAGEEAPKAEGEPPRTCADISIGDERWVALAGFVELIPDLVRESLLGAELSPETRTVSIALLSDAEVRSLNKAFRGNDAATNVLSFPSAPALLALKHQREPIFLGDVALGYETVRDESAMQRKPALHHAAHLVVHGVLHLAGFDHGDDAGAERMESAERVILGRFDIPDPYRDDGPPPATALRS